MRKRRSTSSTDKRCECAEKSSKIIENDVRRANVNDVRCHLFKTPLSPGINYIINDL